MKESINKIIEFLCGFILGSLYTAIILLLM